MSANNYIRIHKEWESGDFIIEDLCDDTDEGREVHRSRTIEEAIEFAQQYQADNIVEYGIRFGVI